MVDNKQIWKQLKTEKEVKGYTIDVEILRILTRNPNIS